MIYAWSGNVTPSVVQAVDECFHFSTYYQNFCCHIILMNQHKEVPLCLRIKRFLQLSKEITNASLSIKMTLIRKFGSSLYSYGGSTFHGRKKVKDCEREG